MRELRQSTAVTHKCGPFVDTAGNAVTTLTIQKADVRLSKNGGNMASASANQGTADVGMSHDEIGMYDMSLDSTDTNTLGHLQITIKESGALHVLENFMVLTQDEWDAKYSTGERAVQLSTTGKAHVNAEVLDVLNVDTFSEPGQGNPSATPTIRSMLHYLYKAWRNKWTQTSTTYSLFADNGSTVDQKATVSDDGSTSSKAEVVTGL